MLIVRKVRSREIGINDGRMAGIIGPQCLEGHNTETSLHRVTDYRMLVDGRCCARAAQSILGPVLRWGESDIGVVPLVFD